MKVGGEGGRESFFRFSLFPFLYDVPAMARWISSSGRVPPPLPPL